MMDSTSYVEVLSINNRYDKYYGKVIKDFYRGSLDNHQPLSITTSTTGVCNHWTNWVTLLTNTGNVPNHTVMMAQLAAQYS